MSLRLVLPMLVPLLVTLIVIPAQAQSGGVFEISRSTIDGGGSTERSTGDIWIRGTIGQPDVGATSAGSFKLRGGFWATEGPFGALFLDGFESGDTSAWSASVGGATFIATPPPPLLPPAPSAARPEEPIELSQTSASVIRCPAGGICPDRSE